jgi:siderophore synthetase component
MVLKDFIDDINLVDEDFPELAQLPSEADLLLRHEATDLSHFIFTGLFMVHYRYICNVFLQDYPEYSELDFGRPFPTRLLSLTNNIQNWLNVLKNLPCCAQPTPKFV